MEICEQNIARSHVFVGIYGAEGGKASLNRSASPIEEELAYARKQTPNCTVLLFVREALQRDPQLDDMLRQTIVGKTIPLSEDDDVAFSQIFAEIGAAIDHLSIGESPVQECDLSASSRLLLA